MSKDEVTQLTNHLNMKFDNIDKHFGDIDKHFGDIDKHFGDIDKKFGYIDKHFLNLQRYIDNRFDNLDKKLDEKASQTSVDNLTNTTDYIVGRLSDIELETASRDAKVDRIYSWTEKASVKLGIPLEY